MCLKGKKENNNHGPEVQVLGKKDIVPRVGAATMQKGNLKYAGNQIEEKKNREKKKRIEMSKKKKTYRIILKGDTRQLVKITAHIWNLRE